MRSGYSGPKLLRLSQALCGALRYPLSRSSLVRLAFCRYRDVLASDVLLCCVADGAGIVKYCRCPRPHDWWRRRRSEPRFAEAHCKVCQLTRATRSSRRTYFRNSERGHTAIPG
jgi:hypothetical protein